MWIPVADFWQIESGELLLVLEPRQGPDPWRLVVYREERTICSRAVKSGRLDEAKREALDVVEDFSRDFLGEVNALGLLSRRAWAEPTVNPTK